MLASRSGEIVAALQTPGAMSSRLMLLPQTLLLEQAELSHSPVPMSMLSVLSFLSLVLLSAAQLSY